MDKQKPVIFLSASIPKPERDPRFYNCADFTAIRDAVIGLVNAIIPDFCMVWGGHPAITPIIANIFEKRGYKNDNLITLYQSDFFKSDFPEEDKNFSNFIRTEVVKGADGEPSISASLQRMRERMIGENNIVAAVFIGGMEGIKDEADIVKRLKPNAKLFPVASTGGAASVCYKNIIKESNPVVDEKLHFDMAYTSLFKELFTSLK